MSQFREPNLAVVLERIIIHDGDMRREWFTGVPQIQDAYATE